MKWKQLAKRVTGAVLAAALRLTMPAVSTAAASKNVRIKHDGYLEFDVERFGKYYITGSASPVPTPTPVPTSTPTPAPSGETVKMYRMYNPNSGEHFFTNTNAEKNMLIKAGWKYEGIGFYALNFTKN